MRFLRKAVDLYIEGVENSKNIERQEEKCAAYNRLRIERIKSKVLNSWLLFKANHQKAKDYWYRIFLRLELSRKL